MKVYFIGAGPGASDLITVRGAKILEKSKLVLYAGSLVSETILEYCSAEAECINTASLNLEQQMNYYQRAKEKNINVVRVHSGDPALYGATTEQMKRLHHLGVEYEVIPGVSSFTASAACVALELTKPSVGQSVILTRMPGRASSMPELESLERLAAHQSTMCIFLSGPYLAQMVSILREHYPQDTPIILVHKATWPQEKIHRSTLATVVEEVKIQEWALSTMVLVGAVLKDELLEESKLYASDYSHKFRTKEKTSVE